MSDADRTQIVEVMVRYAQAVDDRDFELLRTVFTAGGRFGRDPGVVGVDAIIAHISGMLAHCGVTQHLLGNELISIDGVTASTRCSVRAWHRGAGEHGDLVYEMVGYYHDEMVRTAEGWRTRARWLEPRSRIGPRALVLGVPDPPAGQ